MIENEDKIFLIGWIVTIILALCWWIGTIILSCLVVIAISTH